MMLAVYMEIGSNRDFLHLLQYMNQAKIKGLKTMIFT